MRSTIGSVGTKTGVPGATPGTFRLGGRRLSEPSGGVEYHGGRVIATHTIRASIEG